ncbi:MAG: SelB C-terminal domain-containing protein [Myxococcaceae bacterium]
MVVGTAGHVDHGKTSLVRALTGIDTDRLPEEKKRGITLELGFAHLALPSGRTVGVVDVPGHERFLRAMVAGAGGVDLALLVVAADEGVMPQTREHVEICTLLGVRAGILVVTKSDLLPGLGEGWLELLEADLRALTEGTPFEGAPLVAVSARTQENLAELVRVIDEQAAKIPLSPEGERVGVRGDARDRGAAKSGGPSPQPSPRSQGEGVLPLAPVQRGPDAPFFLPIDRAFTLKGFGLVVTGTVWAGRVKVDDELTLLPSGTPCRARTVQVHGAAVSEAVTGQRVAINLPDLGVDDVSRGQALCRRGAYEGAKAVDVELSLLPRVASPLKARSRQLVSLGTAQIEAVVRLTGVAELRPGERCFAQLRFAQPVAAVAGQRFVLRSTAATEHLTTLGGGAVVLVNPPRRRGAAQERVEALATGTLEERLRLHLVEAGYAGLDESALTLRLSASPKELGKVLEQAAARGVVTVLPKRADQPQRHLVATEVLRALQARALARLDQLHRDDPEKNGFPREELRQRLGSPGERVFARALEELVQGTKVEVEAELLRLPGRGRAFTEAAKAAHDTLRAVLEERGLSPPTLTELASRLKRPEAAVEALGQQLVAQGFAVRAGELFFARAAITALEAKLRTFFETNEKLSTQAFKELTGLSRKFLIPLAEYFDREKLTLRVGDERVLRKR